jgi:hypothetical protein
MQSSAITLLVNTLSTVVGWFMKWAPSRSPPLRNSLRISIPVITPEILNKNPSKLPLPFSPFFWWFCEKAAHRCSGLLIRNFPTLSEMWYQLFVTIQLFLLFSLSSLSFNKKGVATSSRYRAQLNVAVINYS